MRDPVARLRRGHWQVAILLPLAVILTTWPTLPHVFNTEEFWLHTPHRDKWLYIWNAWHVERALGGETQLFHSDSIFHPRGLTLAFQPFSFPHILLLIGLRAWMPVDIAYNLLFLLILCFNGICGYLLIFHLLRDKWIALFGALVIAVALPYPFGSTAPDLITIGTLPLTLYFLHRALMERRPRFAVLAGLCAGFTAYISLYILAFALMSATVYCAFLAPCRWQKPAFWRSLLLFASVCAAVGLPRIYPIIADQSVYQEGVEAHLEAIHSFDALNWLATTRHPVTGELFRAVYEIPPDNFNYNAYLGYINLFLAGFALLRGPRRRLLPWLTAFALFAVFTLGDYFTWNGIAYEGIALPKRVLTDWLPAIFGNIYIPQYYQFAMVTPLALLACYGLAALARTPPRRFWLVAAAALILLFEFAIPRHGETLQPAATQYIPWLRAEPDRPIKLIHLPEGPGNPHYFMFQQTLTGYPQANGFQNRLQATGHSYIKSNLILNAWHEERSIHCLPHNRAEFEGALDQLLADGFTHVVLHEWLYGDQFVIHSFANVIAAYQDHVVGVYRLADLRQSCAGLGPAPPQFERYALSQWALPGPSAGILSLHPSESVDQRTRDYLNSVFAGAGILHLNLADEKHPELDAFLQEIQIISLIYESAEIDAPEALLPMDAFELCQREDLGEGVTLQRYIQREFDCAILTAGSSFSVEYDKGAKLQNVFHEFADDALELQFHWSALPDETHSVSLQIFDAAGQRALGQDSVIPNQSLVRQSLDLSALPPGAYTVKLIVYNFESGASAPGQTVDGARFERELELLAFRRD